MELIMRYLKAILNKVKGFILALQFLTIVPIGIEPEIDKAGLSRASMYFPLVGLVLGLVLVGINQFLLLIPLRRLLINVIMIVSLLLLTGGLHMDGLADTFDALSSRKDKSEMLKIMRDSHIGTMGVLSLVSIILIKLALLSSLHTKAMVPSLILMCLLSRYSLVFSMFLFPYARKEGKGEVFIEGMNLKIFSLATLISLICAVVFLQLKGVMLFIMVMGAAFVLGKFFTNKFGGITGDTLGATNELVEGFVLFSVVILRGI